MWKSGTTLISSPEVEVPESCKAELVKSFPGSTDWDMNQFRDIQWGIELENGRIEIIILGEPRGSRKDLGFYYTDDRFPEHFSITLDSIHHNQTNDLIDIIAWCIKKDERTEHEDEYISPVDAEVVFSHPFTPEWETDPKKIYEAWYRASFAHSPKYIRDIIEDGEKALEIIRLHPDFVEESVDELDEVSDTVKNAIPSWKAGWIPVSHWKNVAEEARKKWLLK